MFSRTKDLGARGEDAAARFLRRAGYAILARNFTCTLGEIDIICHQDDTIVFVEVKTRECQDSADPEENITPAKQRQIHRVARFWLARHDEPDCAYRFDAVTVILPPKGRPDIQHWIAAFAPLN